MRGRWPLQGAKSISSGPHSYGEMPNYYRYYSMLARGTARWQWHDAGLDQGASRGSVESGSIELSDLAAMLPALYVPRPLREACSHRGCFTGSSGPAIGSLDAVDIIDIDIDAYASSVTLPAGPRRTCTSDHLIL